MTTSSLLSVYCFSQDKELFTVGQVPEQNHLAFDTDGVHLSITLRMSKTSYKALPTDLSELTHGQRFEWRLQQPGHELCAFQGILAQYTVSHRPATQITLHLNIRLVPQVLGPTDYDEYRVPWKD